ncbi:hypothetical protein D3C75_1183240 [compost metagenome]
MELSAVPPMLPWMPASPSLPAMAEAVSRSTPRPAATGPTYFMVSPNICRSTLARVKVPTITSPSRVIWFAGSLKPVRMLEPISAAVAISTPPALAMSSTPGIASRIALGVKPAMARKP